VSSSENDIPAEELWNGLAAMESRITVLESQLEEALSAVNRKRDESMMKDAIVAGDDAFVCLKFARGEECVMENRLRRIGFDKCFDRSCQWVFKIE
jgi:hypothetical protein